MHFEMLSANWKIYTKNKITDEVNDLFAHTMQEQGLFSNILKIMYVSSHLSK